MTPTQRVQNKMSALPDRFKQTQGQPGGIRSIPSQGKRDAFVNLQRQKFFGDRDVPEERVLRRTAQEGALNQFKSALERGGRTVGGLTTASGDPVYLAQTPGGRTVSSYAQDLAYRFGPTPREIAGDIGYGLGQFGSALGERISQGRIGILGIARDLYEQFTNSATKAKDALVKGVNKLSDIDLEILKNKDQYKFLSKKPEIQEVDNLQKTQMTEFDKANLIRQNMEKISMPVTEKDNTVESAKVFDDSFRRLPATGMTQQPPGFKVMPTSYFPGQFGATPVPNNIQQAQNPNELRRALMENTMPMPNNFPQEKPYLMQQDDYYYQDKERFSPTGNQYLYAAEGGSVDSKLNDIQKKTNNIYGTGILSVR